MTTRLPSFSTTASRLLTSSIVVTAVTLASTAAADKPATSGVDPCAGAAARYVVTPTAVMLHALAACHEQHGQTASAWAEYLEAATTAQREKSNDTALSARQHASALEARLSTLAVRVAPGWDIAGLEVRRDGMTLVRAAWGTAGPVDPGEHRIEATAPGKLPWVKLVNVRPGTSAQTVEVGPLEEEGAGRVAVAVGVTSLTSATMANGAIVASDSPLSDHPVQVSSGSTQRGIGIALAGIGLAGVGVGTYFGIQTLDKSDAARQACPTTPCSDRSAVTTNDEAKTASTISTISFAAGGGLMLLGSILFFTAPSTSRPAAIAKAPPPRRPSFDVSASPAVAGLRLGGDV